MNFRNIINKASWQKNALIILTILHLSFNLSVAYAKENFTWENYNKILASVSTSLNLKNKDLDQSAKHTTINYQKLVNSSELNQVLKKQEALLANHNEPTNRKDKLAFWINAYNFFTLVDVKNNYPIKSMKDIGWKNKTHLVNHKKYSLDQIENEILRPLGEPRIHFAINCASTSCPSLRRSAYNATNLDKQLDQSVNNAFKDPLNLQLNTGFFGEEYLASSKILQWFARDFKVKPYGSVQGFINTYKPAAYSKINSYKTNINYNWQLNTKANIQAEYNKITK